MSDEDLAFCSALELARLVAQRAVSPVELLDLCAARIERYDDQLNSLVTLDLDRAREQALAAEQHAGAEDAPAFLGVPLAVKDLWATAGLRTTFGAKLLADFVPDADDEVVARLRRAGFVLLGKTNTPELGTSPVTESRLLGVCRNPWDLTRTPGGSSGGAAAALAAGLVPAAPGSDGAGSARIPASCCGLVGLKPSRGRVPNGPGSVDVAGLASPGPITRSVADAAAMLDVMAGSTLGEPYWAPPPTRPFVTEAGVEPPTLRAGLVTSWPLADFDAEAVRAAEDAARLLEALGHHVEPFHPTVDPRTAHDFRLLWSASVASLAIDPAELEPFNAWLFQLGRSASAADLVEAMGALRQQSRELLAAAAGFDVLVSPTLAEPPLPIGTLEALEPVDRFDRASAFVGCTPVANMTGQPAVSLPLGHGPGGLPLGVTLAGRPADEATLLQLAGQLQRAADWSARRPPLTAAGEVR